MALTDKAHELISTHFETVSVPPSLAVDATCGNGHDTLFLAKLGFEKVIGFDIQQKAITATNLKLKKAHIENIKLVHAGHENIGSYTDQKIDCIMFNLGYLPSANKDITTKATTTLSALKFCLTALSKGGLISLMCYPGHPAGLEENNAIKKWLINLDDCWDVSTHQASSPKPTAPILYLLRKR